MSRVFEWVLIGLLIYEVVALQSKSDNVHTITELLKKSPLYVSIVALLVIALAVTDHIYFQVVVP